MGNRVICRVQSGEPLRFTDGKKYRLHAAFDDPRECLIFDDYGTERYVPSHGIVKDAYARVVFVPAPARRLVTVKSAFAALAAVATLTTLFLAG